MNASVLDLPELFRPEQLRGAGPSASGLAEFMRASAAVLFDSAGEAPSGSPLPLSGRAVRVDVTERLLPLFSFGTTVGNALFGASGQDVDVTAPQLRAVFDALLEVGDFIDVEHGRFYPSRTRAVALGPDAWVLVSGSPSGHLDLSNDQWSRCCFSRVVARLPRLPVIAQSMNAWLGLDAPDYVRFSETQLAQPLQPLRQGMAGWKIARLESARTDWIDPEEAGDFAQPVVARYRPDEQQPWQRFIARIQRGPHGVECVAARPINYRDCSRTLHGQKMLRGFTPRLRSAGSPTDFRVTCDSYFLAEVQRLLLALSFDFTEAEGVTEYRFAPSLRPLLENALADLGVKLSGDRDHG